MADAINFESLNFEISVNASKAAEEVRALKTAVSGLGNALKGLDRTVVTKAFPEVAKQAENAARRVERALGKLEKAANGELGEKAGIGGYTQNLEQATDDAMSLADAMQMVRNAMSSVSDNVTLGESLRENATALSEAVDEVKATAGRGAMALQSFNTGVEAVSGSVGAAIGQTRTYSQVSKTLEKVTKTLTPAFEAAGKSVEALQAAMTAAAGPISAVIIAFQAAYKIATFITDQFNEFIDVLKKTKKILDSLSERFNPFGGIKKEIASIIALAKRQVLRRAINAVIKAITEGFKSGIDNLARYDAEFGAVMQSFKNSLGLFKNSIGVAVAPIISYFIPAINKLLAALTAAMNTLARLTALLTGKRTYTVAKGYEEIGESAGGASSKVKELQRTILGFDEINKLNGQNGSGSGGGGGAGDAISAYETLEVGEWPYESWGEALEAFLKWLNGTGVPKLREGFEKISKLANNFSRGLYDALTYGNVQEYIGDLGKNIGEAINNFLNGGEGRGGLNWQDMGRAFGQTLKAAFGFAANLITSVDFIQLGANIASSLRTALEQLDEKDIRNIADTVYGVLTAGIKTAIGFLLNAPWSTLGFDAATFINRLVENITRDLDNIKWGRFWTEFEKGLNTFLNTVDWGALFGTATRIISGIISGVERVLETLMKNKEFMSALRQFVDFVAETAVKWFMLKVKALAQMTGGFNIWRMALSGFGDSAMGIFDNFDPLGSLDSFERGLADASDATEDFEDTATAALHAVDKASSTMSGSVARSSDAAKNAIAAIGASAQTTSTTVGTSATNINGHLEKMATDSAKPVSDFNTTIGKVGTAAKNAAAEVKRQTVGDSGSVVAFTKTMNTDATKQVEALRSSMATKFSQMSSNAATEAEATRKSVVDKVTLAKNQMPAFNDVGANIKNGIINGMGDFKGQLDQWASQFKDRILKNFNIKSPSKWARDFVGEYITEGIAEGMLGSSAVETACRGLKEGIASQFDDAQFYGGVSATTGRGVDIAGAIGNQITSGLASMTANGNDRPIVCEVYLDRDKIATAVTRAQQSQNRRYSSTAMAY